MPKKSSESTTQQLALWVEGAGEENQRPAIEDRRGARQWLVGPIESKRRTIGRHGETKEGKRTHEYNSWSAMLQRCLNPKLSCYRIYGGRGIKVCVEWRSFAVFLADMGRAPTEAHQIDRINNDGNYEPSNCRWATRKQQANNRRTNNFVEYRGARRTVQEWGEIFGNVAVFKKRIESGWSPERAFNQPIQDHGRKVSFNGLTLSVYAWAKRIGLEPRTLRTRLSKWPIEVALTTPPRVWKTNA